VNEIDAIRALCDLIESLCDGVKPTLGFTYAHSMKERAREIAETVEATASEDWQQGQHKRGDRDHTIDLNSVPE
jgi:hypothetical protein